MRMRTEDASDPRAVAVSQAKDADTRESPIRGRKNSEHRSITMRKCHGPVREIGRTER